jgi:hypothetical protein
MKTARLILIAGLLLATTSFTFAGPGAWYFTHRRAQAPKAAPTTPATKNDAACPHCKVTTAERPIGPGKVTMRTGKMDCSGCTKMAAGEKC